MKVPFFDNARETAAAAAELEGAWREVTAHGQFIGGPEVAAFETDLAAWAGCAHVVGVSSGSDALLVSAMALDIGPGANVVTTPFTFFATAGSFLRTGASVRFADIDDETLNLCPRQALAATDRATRAIVTVGLFGLPPTLPEFACVIEDGAQHLGRQVVRSQAFTTSFFPTKHLGALGDGGAVLTNDSALAARVRLLRNHGAAPKYHHAEIGGNFRLDALQAACLRRKLVRLDAQLARRRDLAAAYHALFARTPHLRLPPDSPDHSYHQFVVRLPTQRLRDGLRQHLSSLGIGSEIYYPEPLHTQPCLAHAGYRQGSFPVAERACQQVLALPCFPTLTSDEQAQVGAAVVGYCRTM